MIFKLIYNNKDKKFNIIKQIVSSNKIKKSILYKIIKSSVTEMSNAQYGWKFLKRIKI